MSVYSFSQGAVQSAFVQYIAYALTDAAPVITLVWPSSYSNSPNVVGNFMNVTDSPTAPTVGTLILPDATQVSVGTNFFIFNSSARTIQIQKDSEDDLVAITAGSTYAFYLSAIS